MKTEHLKNLEIPFEALVKTMSCGVVVIDSQGTIRWMNHQAQQWLDPSIGMLWRDVVGKAFAPMTEVEDELTLHTGLKIKLETNPLPTQAGQMILLYDVTQSRAVQDQLNQAKRLQMLGNMCASLAHQIRNPLFSALVKVETLFKRYPQERKIETLRSNLKAIEQEINAILLFSKSDKTVVERIKLEPVLLQAIQVSNIENKEILIDYSAHLFDEETVLGNAQALTGVFTNLIANAIEASPPQSTILIRLFEKAHHFEVLIRDEGAGIEAQQIKHVFEPFFTTKPQGTGLGLSVAQQVIKNHHGDITLSSHPRQGTEVRVSLPKG